MPRSVTLLAALLALPFASAFADDKKDVKGPCTYRTNAVTVAGKNHLWSRLKSLTDVAPDRAADVAEHDRRLPRATTATTLVALGKWCREQGLEDQAAAAYKQALALDADNASARRGAGFARTAEGWKPAAEVYRTKYARVNKKDARALVALSDWCKDRALLEQTRDLLVMALAVNGYDKRAIARMDTRVKRRYSSLVYSPPFEGRWLAHPDPTRHHKTKIWAIYAIDYVKVDKANKKFSGSNMRRLSAWYGFGAPVYAAADGVVFTVTDGHPDLPVGTLGAAKKNNEVTLQHANGEYTVYAHMKRGSITVKKGQAVKRGQKIGEVGNSGKSNLPHLHFALMVPAHSRQSGQGCWVSVPYHFKDFRLARLGTRDLDVEIKVGAPQEGWVLECPGPAKPEPKPDDPGSTGTPKK